MLLVFKLLTHCEDENAPIVLATVALAKYGPAPSDKRIRFAEHISKLIEERKAQGDGYFTATFPENPYCRACYERFNHLFLLHTECGWAICKSCVHRAFHAFVGHPDQRSEADDGLCPHVCLCTDGDIDRIQNLWKIAKTLVDPQIAEQYGKVLAEWTAHLCNGSYCSTTSCRRLISTGRSDSSQFVLCSDCHRSTCVKCKGPSETHGIALDRCPDISAEQAKINAEQEQIRKLAQDPKSRLAECPRCHVVWCKDKGCNSVQ